MRKYLLVCLLVTASFSISRSQSCANYTVVRTTGITYTSVAPTATVIPFWRGQVANQNDDNRSNPIPIGFDFWYLGVRYTTCSVSINGFIDFSTTSYDGNWPLSDPSPQPPGYAACGQISYREDGAPFQYSPCGNGVPPNSYDGTYWALCPMYCDLWCSNGVNALANSIKYKTSGAAPNRIFTVEYLNMDDWASSLVSDYNFQINLYETTGKIEFVYGTMFQVAGSVPYACGMNGRIFTTPAAASELLSQQGDNSAVFNNTVAALHNAAPTSNSKITFTPPVPANPGSVLTFSGVGNTAMTLNWTDWASNEDGYVIYMSTDGINYSFYAQTAANAISYTATSLFGTTYYWKVYAVTEGCLSSAISGTQATTVGSTYYSRINGNWGTASTWSTAACGGAAAGTIPTLGDNVVICNGTTVTVDGNYGCTTLTVGGGASGILYIGNDATARSFQVLSTILVNSGGTLSPNPSFAATHTLTETGSIVNNGTVNMRPNATSLCNIIFNKDGNQNINGTGVTNSYNTITINMGSTVSNTLDVISTNFSAPSNFLTMTNGTFKFSVPANSVTLDIFTSATTIPATCGLWMNSPNSTMTAHSTLNFQGGLTCSQGIVNVGDNADETLMSNGALLTISGGTVNVSGRLDRPSFVAVTNVVISGGTLNLNTVGSTSVTSAPFMIDVIGSSFSMSGGTIVIKNMGGGGANLGYTNTNYPSATFYSVTGGTLQIGNASTSAGQTMQINTNIPVGNLVVSTTNSPTAILNTNNLTVVSNVNINTGSTLNLNNLNLTLGGNWTKDGTFTPGTGTVSFNSSSATTQTIGGTGATTFYNLDINNSGTGGVTQSLATTVSNTLSMTTGALILNALTLTITNAATTGTSRTNGYVLSENTSNLGKIQWNMGSTTGAHVFPFGSSAGTYIPFTFDLTAGTIGNVTVSTYPTNAANLPLPTTPNAVTNIGNFQNNSVNTVDRFWQIDKTGVSGTATLTFMATVAEVGTITTLKAEHWNTGTSLWDPLLGGQTSFALGASVPGVTTFSPWTLSGNTSPLPVSLLNFNAAPDDHIVDLDWTTLTETNNDFFTVEKSKTGTGFEFVGTVDGAGNSNTIHVYRTVDESPFSGVSYYRLKQTDFNGSFTYSNVVAVDMGGDGTALDLTVFPNPSDGAFSIDVNGGGKEILVVLYDALGREVYSKIIVTGSSGGTLIAMDPTASLAPGVYIVSASVDDKMCNKKLVIK